MKDFALKILNAKKGRTYIFSVGQAGFVIKSASGQILGIDLYLSECVERVEGHIGFKRLLPKILDAYDLEFDCLVATHPHVDHFDIDAMPHLLSNQKTRLYASVDCEREVERLSIKKDNTAFVKPGDVFCDGDFKLEFVDCDHGTGAPDAVGLIITVDGKRIYIAGDTCLHLEQAETIKNIDIMIAPINGAYGNLNEKECSELSNVINPKLTIPCHYGMFASHGGNPGLFKEYMEKKKLPFIFMALGEQFELREF